jgi:MYXO-CTERM domain-containing protein
LCRRPPPLALLPLLVLAALLALCLRRRRSL